MTPWYNCYIIIYKEFILDQRKIPVQLPIGTIAYLTFHKTNAGEWVSILENQSMVDLTALLKGEELKQEYVEPTVGDIPSWVTL